MRKAWEVYGWTTSKTGHGALSVVDFRKPGQNSNHRLGQEIDGDDEGDVGLDAYRKEHIVQRGHEACVMTYRFDYSVNTLIYIYKGYVFIYRSFQSVGPLKALYTCCPPWQTCFF